MHESNCRGASPTPSARLIDLRAGEGVYFDGVDDYVELDNVELGGPMTISLWVKWEAITDTGHLFDFSNGDTNNNIKIKNDQTTNTLQLELTQGIDSAARTSARIKSRGGGARSDTNSRVLFAHRPRLRPSRPRTSSTPIPLT